MVLPPAEQQETPMTSLVRHAWIRTGFVGLTLIAIIGVGKVAIFAPHAHAAAPVRAFVTRVGSHLRLRTTKSTGKPVTAAASNLPFRFSGANMEWFGHDAFASTTPFTEDDALGTMNEMGGTVARSLWLTSLGTAGSLQPSLGVYDAAAFDKVDYAIKRAGDYGIHLIIPLVDGDPNGDGAYTYYPQWRNISDTSQFFTNATLIGDYENFISTYLNHVNDYTGVANKDNPTILGWEVSNEISAPQSWTQTICDYIKSIDGNHLVGSSPVANQINNDDLGVSSLDFVDDHFYPMNVGNLNSHAATVTGAGKAYIAGEYDWSNYTGGDDLGSFLSAVEGNGNVSGDLFWELFPHLDTYGFAQYNAGAFGTALGLHYPGDSTDMRTRVQQLRSHAFAMQGQSVPGHNVPAAPIITAVASTLVYWSGVPAADNYSIERSTDGADGPWSVICDHCVNDNNAPYTDGDQPHTGSVWYRIRAFNLNGAAGNYSAVYQTQGYWTVPNSGFETPSLGYGNFQADPTSAGWSFDGSAGISANGSGYTNGNPGAPESSQVAYIQGTGSISIPVTLQAGTRYCVTFSAAQRGNYNNGGEDFKLQFDGSAVVGTFKPAETRYDPGTSPLIIVDTPDHTLQFVGLDSGGGDNTAFIDAVGLVNC